MDGAAAKLGENPLVIRRGLLALAHPLAVVSLAVWLVNDHVLKSRAPGLATGKLSDVAGAVFLPLVIAALIEPVSRHAVRVGMAATGFVLVAINVVPAADAAYEGVLSLVVPSANTMDATDLLAVPFVLVAGWVWRRVSVADRPLRRAWGRALLGTGIVASMATSPDVPFSEQFEGTHFLTEDNPSVELATTFQVNGDDAEIEDGVSVSLDLVAFGDSESPDESPIVVTMEGTGEGTITLALRDPEAGPVEVSWSVYAEGSAGSCVPFCIIDTDERVPTLTIVAPPDTFGPRPIARVELNDDRPELFTIEVALPAGESDITARVDRLLPATRVVLRHAGAEYPLEGMGSVPGERESTLLPRPAGCDEGCTVEIQLSALPGSSLAGDESIEFYSAPNDDGDAAGATVARTTLESSVVTLDVILPSVTIVRSDVLIPIAVELPESPQFGDVLRIRPLLSDALAPFYNISVWPESSRALETAADRCFRGEFEIVARARPEDGSLPPVDATAQIRVVYRTTDAIDRAPVVAIGEEADALC